MSQRSQTRVLFVDLDGTLLNDEKQITAKNLLTIRQALDAGHKIVISTGRPTASAKKLAKQLSLTSEGCYAITFNGACIYDLYKKETLFSQTLSPEYVRHLMTAAAQAGIYSHIYSDTHILTQKDSPELRRYASSTSMPYRIVTDPLLEPDAVLSKVILIDYENRQKLEAFQSAMKDWMNGKADSFFSCDFYLEVVPPKVSKGNAIRIFCEKLRIPLENTVSAGDAENDIAMLQTTAVSAVMKNASAQIYPYGNYITRCDNNHDGVTEIIEKFILQNNKE